MAAPAAAAPTRVRRPYRLRRWLVAGFGMAALVAIYATLLRADRWHARWDEVALERPILVAHLFATTVAVAAGIWLTWRRPANRCGPVAVVLGVVFGLWLVGVMALPERGQWRNVSPTLVILLRPLLFWLVLAFPIGRLDRVSRRALMVIIAGSLSWWVIFAFQRNSDPDWPSFYGIWRWTTWSWLASSAWWDVGGLFTAVAVLVIVHRRGLRFRTLGDRVGTTALWAALIATGADFLMIGAGPIRDLQYHADGPTPFGMTVQLVDYTRWGVVVALLAVAARRAWPRDPAVGNTIELGSAGVDDSLRLGLARALGDPDADVAVRDASSQWIDLAGHPRAEPGGERAVTIVAHNGAAIAALEYDDALTAHPAVIDAAVAALALQLESGRQLALARGRERELRELARDVLEAEDEARGRLERDLHDGAQQALVGLTLQAALAARNGSGSSGGTTGQLADAVDDVAAMLHTIATGRPPALLAERGLDGALGALVATAGLPVTVELDRCTDLPERMQRAIWFTAAEAVTNALKHSGAAHLRVTLRRSDEEVTLSVVDDGGGGVDRPPASLQQRVADVDGRLDLKSDAAGTVVRARFPLAAVVAG